MLIRALIVLLLVLNLGVALWWVARTSPVPATRAEPVPGIARLQLVAEARPDPAPSPPPKAEAVIRQCVSFGPFTDAAQASQAQSRLRPRAVQLRPRREYAGIARSWKVFLPAFANMDAAEAAAARVAGAGFKDYFVVREGDEARSLALGLYRSEATARERVATLGASGFQAELAPLGAGPVEHWLDVGAAAGFDVAAAQALVAAARVETIDCARFIAAGAAPAR